MVRLARAALIAALVSVAASCGGGSETETEGRTERAPSTTDQSPAAETENGSVADPDGIELGNSWVENAEPHRALTVEPCSLLDVDTFGSWLGGPVSEPVELESGRACGVTDEDESTRVAIMVVWAGPATGFFTTSERDRASAAPAPLDGWWLAGAPVPESDQLVAVIDANTQLVVEVTDGAGRPDQERLDLASAVAQAALSRV